MARLSDTATCPLPLVGTDRILLGHGSGGKLSAALLRDQLMPRFGNPILAELGDGAVLTFPGLDLVISTDTFVVNPLEFPGGDIGLLAVHGTANDLAMMGAEPRYLTAGFVIEEGLPIAVFERILDSMAGAARAAGLVIVTGDTKVVERGKADGLFVNTTGLGIRHPGFAPGPTRGRPDDVVLVSGPLGRHGMAIMATREGLEFRSTIESDTASLYPLVRALREAVGDQIRTLRDPTRGGLASALNEIAAASGVGIAIDQGRLVVPDDVAAACEMLGLDPLYVANEGVLMAVVAPDGADAALAALRNEPLGREAFMAGRLVASHTGMVVLRTPLGATRIVDLLPGDQLPRIC